MLTCSCGDDSEWYYAPADGVAPLATKRWRKCCSCKVKIQVGEDCRALRRWRHPGYETVAERIYGDGGEEPLTTWYLCDRCAGLYESLNSLGFCITMPANLVHLCREYGEMQRDAGVFRGKMTLHDPRALVSPAGPA